MLNMNELEKEFVPYKESLTLKELGFDEPCLAFSYVKSEFGYIAHEVYLIDYLDDDSIVKNSEKEYYYARPTFSQAFRWFRDKHDLTSEVSIEQYRRNTDKKWMFSVTWLNKDAMYDHSKTTFKSYEEAELELLKKLIELVKK